MKAKIPLKFRQIADSNFVNLPAENPLKPLMLAAGTDELVDTDTIQKGIDWLNTHGESLELKPEVTPGKGLKRLKNCLNNSLSEAVETTKVSKPTRR